MPWPLFKVVSQRRVPFELSVGGSGTHVLYTLPDGREVDFQNLPPGAMFHSSEIPPLDDGFRLHQNQPSVVVLLPGQTFWYMSHPGSNGHLWTVTGEIPNTSAAPSINFVGIYHGYVQSGVVTDDVDGRKFDALGNKVG